LESGEAVEHFESHRDTLYLVVVLIAAVLGIGLFASTVFISHDWGYPAGVGAGIVLVFFLYKLHSPMTLRITTDEISFGFPLHKWRFKRSDLIFCMPYEKTTTTPNVLCGWRGERDTFRAPVLDKTSLREAVRLLKPDELLTAVGQDGPAIRMEFKNARRPYSVFVSDPMKVCALLESSEAVIHPGNSQMTE
jgi:hypothetical protein